MTRTESNHIADEIVAHLTQALTLADRLVEAGELSDGLVKVPAGRPPLPTALLALRVAALDMVAVLSDHDAQRLTVTLNRLHALRVRYGLTRP